MGQAKPKQRQPQEEDVEQQTPRQRTGRPPGSKLPVVVRSRVSYFIDAQLAVISQMTGEKRSDIVRLAINHYMAAYADFDDDLLKHVLSRMASVLRSHGDKEALCYLANDSSRFFGISSMEACKMLGISVDVLNINLPLSGPSTKKASGK